MSFVLFMNPRTEGIKTEGERKSNFLKTSV